MCAWPQILKRLHRGDEAAFAVVMDRLGPALLGYLRRSLGDEHAAEEIFSETWLRFARTVRRVRSPEALRSYLFRIAWNLVRDELAMRRRDPLASSMPLERAVLDRQAVRDPLEDGAVRAEHREQREALREAIGQLDPELRQVVILRTYAGLKFRQIAEVLELPLGTVLTRMRKAIERLHEQLIRTRPSEGGEVNDGL